MNTATRMALWRANRKRCFFCTEPITYSSLEIDHLIPQSTRPEELERLRSLLGLDTTFLLDSTLNLVPTHANCNRRKRDTQFSEHSLRYYLEIWSQKQETVESEASRFNAEATRDEILARLEHQVTTGGIAVDEVVGLVRGIRIDKSSEAAPPMVLSFGVNTLELDRDQAWELEEKLLKQLRLTLRRPVVRCEATQYTGETLGVRVALWSADVNRLDDLDLGPWELLEIVPSSEVYDQSPAELLSRAIEETYSIFDAEREGCPECGGQVVVSGMASQTGEMATGTCSACGWEGYYP